MPATLKVLPVLVMEYVDGMDFGRVAALLGPLPIADSCEAAGRRP